MGVVGLSGLLNTIEFNMAVQWWQHGVCVVCAKQTRFAATNYRRFDEGQFTKVGCNTNMSKQYMIVGYLGSIALDDDRLGGRLAGIEWCGEGKGSGWGWGWGWGLGGARGMWRRVTTVPF